MTKILIMFITAFIAISCSNEKDSAIDRIQQKICSTLIESPTAEGIITAKGIWQNEFAKKFEITSKEQTDYLVKFRKCFASMGFKRNIKPLNQSITGTIADYLKLKNDNLQIVLKNEEAPAFSITCVFSGIKQYQDSTEFDVEGSLTLYDHSGKKIYKYNVYPVPDFYLTMKQGRGDFKFTAYLDAIWYPYDKNPFDKAAEAIIMMSKAEYYSFALGIKGENKDKNDEKMNDDEILDNLQILSAPAN